MAENIGIPDFLYSGDGQLTFVRFEPNGEGQCQVKLQNPSEKWVMYKLKPAKNYVTSYRLLHGKGILRPGEDVSISLYCVPEHQSQCEGDTLLLLAAYTDSSATTVNFADVSNDECFTQILSCVHENQECPRQPQQISEDLETEALAAASDNLDRGEGNADPFAQSDSHATFNIVDARHEYDVTGGTVAPLESFSAHKMGEGDDCSMVKSEPSDALTDVAVAMEEFYKIQKSTRRVELWTMLLCLVAIAIYLSGIAITFGPMMMLAYDSYLHPNECTAFQFSCIHEHAWFVPLPGRPLKSLHAL